MNWLDHSRTFREQGVDENETLLLRRKFFYSDQNVDSRDPVQLNLLYVQVPVPLRLRLGGWWGSERHWLGLGLQGSWLWLLSCACYAVPVAWLLGSSHVLGCVQVGVDMSCWPSRRGPSCGLADWDLVAGTLSLSLPGFKALRWLTTSNALKLA